MPVIFLRVYVIPLMYSSGGLSNMAAVGFSFPSVYISPNTDCFEELSF